jgi:NAD(P)-dependent dehydrogenase (short-subunit alcohol dehydrogenase family)
VETAQLDVLDDAAVAEAIGAAGPLDVLFNCAGFVHQNTALTCTDEEWEFAFALNVRAMWRRSAPRCRRCWSGAGAASSTWPPPAPA